MALALSAHIIFPPTTTRGAIDLYRVSSAQVERSWKEFVGRADIVMPRNIKILNGKKYSDIFKKGDPVEIRLGYGTEEPPTEFTGYISEISEGIPVHLRCEDEMYQLKRGSVSVVSGNITLKNLLRKIAPKYQIDCPDMTLGAVRYASMAPVEILSKIKKDFLQHSYFDDKKVLHCGIIYGDQSDVPAANINLEKNAVSENLNKKSATDEVELKAISILKNGKKIQVTVGMRGGTSVQRMYVGVTLKATLEKKARNDLKKYQVEGFDGSVMLFGVPQVQHGMKLHIVSEFYKNMEGTFYIEKTVKKFGADGYRQEVTLGDKAGK
jgi:hypothetical protein